MVISANRNIREKTKRNIPTKTNKATHSNFYNTRTGGRTATTTITKLAHSSPSFLQYKYFIIWPMGSFIRLYARSLAAAVARSVCVEQQWQQQKWEYPNRIVHSTHCIETEWAANRTSYFFFFFSSAFWCVVFFVEANLCFCASAVCPNLWFCCLLPVMVCSSNSFCKMLYGFVRDDDEKKKIYGNLVCSGTAVLSLSSYSCDVPSSSSTTSLSLPVPLVLLLLRHRQNAKRTERELCVMVVGSDDRFGLTILDLLWNPKWWTIHFLLIDPNWHTYHT